MHMWQRLVLFRKFYSTAGIICRKGKKTEIVCHIYGINLASWDTKKVMEEICNLSWIVSVIPSHLSVDSDLIVTCITTTAVSATILVFSSACSCNLSIAVAAQDASVSCGKQ